MDFDSSMRISASGLSANRAWINVLSANLANMNTTRTQDGKPYQRRTIIYESVPSASSFDEVLDNALQEEVQKVQVTDIVADGRDFKEVYDPSHPDADEQGYVKMPDVEVVNEMVDMMAAARAYEANTVAISTAKQMAKDSLDI